MCCIFPRYVMYYVCRVGVCVSQVGVLSKRLNGYIVHYILRKLSYLQKSGYSPLLRNSVPNCGLKISSRHVNLRYVLST